MVNNFDPSEIEEAVGDVIYGLGVSENVFYNRPRSDQKDLTDFVVCKVSGQIVDYRTYGQGTLSVHLFARNVQNFKNGKKLSLMQKTLIEGMPLSIGDCILAGNPRIVGDTDDMQGYHVRIINYTITIKVTN